MDSMFAAYIEKLAGRISTVAGWLARPVRRTEPWAAHRAFWGNKPSLGLDAQSLRLRSRLAAKKVRTAPQGVATPPPAATAVPTPAAPAAPVTPRKPKALKESARQRRDRLVAEANAKAPTNTPPVVSTPSPATAPAAAGAAGSESTPAKDALGAYWSKLTGSARNPSLARVQDAEKGLESFKGSDAAKQKLTGALGKHRQDLDEVNRSIRNTRLALATGGGVLGAGLAYKVLSDR